VPVPVQVAPQIHQVPIAAPIGIPNIPFGIPPVAGGIPSGNIFSPEQQQVIYQQMLYQQQLYAQMQQQLMWQQQQLAA
jgi:hypothetical protein